VANLSLVFDVLAKDNASGTFKNVGDSAERAGKQTSGFGSQMAAGMKVAAGALLGAGLIEGFKSLYQAADESRKIAALTTQVIKSTGGAAGVSAKQVGDLAGAIAKKTGIDDEAIQSGQNLLLTFTNVKNVVGSGNDIFSQATKIMTDMSVALGTDASGSAIQLGKALNDPIKGVTALQRVGVSFTASQKEQIKALVETGDTLGAQKIILAELNKEFGGAAEAAATPLAKLQQRAGDLAEEMGGYLLPIVDKTATFFMDKMLPALSDIGSVVAGTVIPAFKLVSTVVGAVFEAFNNLPGPLKIGLEVFGAYLVLRGPLTTLCSAIGDSVTNMALRMASSVGEFGAFRAAAGGLMTALGGPFGIAILAIAGSFALLSSATEKNKNVTVDTTAAQRDFQQALEATNGVIDESVRKAAAKAAQDAGLLDAAEKAGVATNLVTDALLGNKDAYTQVAGALDVYANNRLIASGYEEHGSTTLHDQADAATAAKDSFADMAGVLPETVSKQQQLSTATKDGAEQTQNFTDKMKDERTALDDAKQAVDDFKLSLDILTGNTVSMIQVESSLNAAIDAGKDAMDKLGGAVLNTSGTLNLQSENGRKAADVLLDIRNRGNDLISTMLQQGATSDQVAAKDAELRASFIRTANQMGITGQNAINLANQILGIPGERTTTIKADTSQAVTAIDNLVQKITTAGGVHVATIRGPAAGPGGTQTRAQGGYISGPGTGTSDSIPAWLSNGEFVVKASATSKHLPLLHALNSGSVPGFADGGLAGEYTIPVGLSQGTLTGLQSKLAAMFAPAGGGGGPAGAGVQRWLPLVIAALNLLGQPVSLAQTTLRRMQQESGGNAQAINNWDINAKRGTPSKGLMQVIDPTFRAYAMPGHSSNIYDPLSNILASMRYAMSRYGSLSAAYNKSGGYAAGTDWVPETGSYVLHKGEAVVPAAANSGWTGGGSTVVLQLDGPAVTELLQGHAVEVVAEYATTTTDRGRFNG
jgi:hypothetical protein